MSSLLNGWTELRTDTLKYMTSAAPSTNLEEINNRLTLVSVFKDVLPASRSYLRALLRTLDDSPRLLQRLYLQRGSAFDLLGLKKTMRALETIREEIVARVPPLSSSQQILVDFGFNSEDEVRVVRDLVERIGRFSQLAREIEEAIDEEALMARTREEEKKAMIAEEYGERHREREEEEETAVRAQEDGLWGEDQPWVVKDA